MQVSVLPYNDEQIEPVKYKVDLPENKGTVLYVSHKTLGVDSNGCGPRPLEACQVHTKPAIFSYQIALANK